MQFIKIVAFGSIKIEIFKDCFDVLLLNHDTRNLDYISLVILDNNVDYFINLCNQFGSILLGEKAAFDTFFDCCNGFFAKFFLYIFLLEVSERSRAFGGNV